MLNFEREVFETSIMAKTELEPAGADLQSAPRRPEICKFQLNSVG